MSHSISPCAERNDKVTSKTVSRKTGGQDAAKSRQHHGWRGVCTEKSRFQTAMRISSSGDVVEAKQHSHPRPLRRRRPTHESTPGDTLSMALLPGENITTHSAWGASSQVNRTCKGQEQAARAEGRTHGTANDGGLAPDAGTMASPDSAVAAHDA